MRGYASGQKSGAMIEKASVVTWLEPGFEPLVPIDATVVAMPGGADIGGGDAAG